MEMFHHHCFSTLFRICHQECPRRRGRIGIDWNPISFWSMLMILISIGGNIYTMKISRSSLRG
jgi:hypothetical protein